MIPIAVFRPLSRCCVNVALLIGLLVSSQPNSSFDMLDMFLLLITPMLVDSREAIWDICVVAAEICIQQLEEQGTEHPKT